MTALNIAAVKFTLTGAGDGVFAPSFAGFTTDDLPFNLQCALHSDGPAAAGGVAADGGQPWCFSAADGQVAVTRHNYDGATLWQMRGDDDFKAARLSWHPTLFATRYQTYRAAWSTGLGFLALGLRLRTAGGVMFHGAAAELDGHGLLCTGVSGVGKSTIARLLHAAGATVLTDERAVIRRAADATFHLHGTLWPSSAGFALNRSAPLRRIYLLKHGSHNRLTPLTAAEAVRRLIPMTMVAWQAPALLDPWLETLEALVETIPCAQLEFRPTAEVVATLRQDL